MSTPLESERRYVTDILLESGVVADAQIEAGLVRLRETGRQIGECLVDLGFVSGEDIAWALGRGLVVVTGPAGSGKSTRLAALIHHRNLNTRGHILTVEDPIEFVHDHHGCVVTQREVGVDTASFAAGLKCALRQADSANDLRLRVKTGAGTNAAEKPRFAIRGESEEEGWAAQNLF